MTPEKTKVHERARGEEKTNTLERAIYREQTKAQERANGFEKTIPNERATVRE